MRRLAPFIGMIFIPAVVLAQGVHPDVQAAVDWQLPENQCEFKIKRSNVTSGSKRKIKKAMKKYRKCSEGYKHGLAEEQQKMMSVAQHGLTQEQADIIMGNMRRIQKILEFREPQFAEVPAGPGADPLGSGQRGGYEH